MRRSAIAVALFCFALNVAALEPPKPNEKWITLTVDEFQFISDASREKTLEVARNMLQMRAAIGQVTNLKTRSKLPIKVFLFGSERKFNAYRDALLQRKGTNINGMFAQGDSGNFILIPAGDRIDGVVYHELTHYVVRNTIGDLPLWFNEGIAEYYSTFRTDGKSMQIGEAVAEHVLWLRSGSLIPLQQLLTTTKDSPLYREDERMGVFYAQSWALVHYLLSDSTRRAKLFRFLFLVGNGKSVDEAFTAAFAMTYAQLEQELRRSVRRFTFNYLSVPLAESAIAELPKPEPMPRDALLFQFGHLLAEASGPNAPIAERFLRESLAINPDNAAAHADLGRVHEALGRRAEADAEYDAAVKLGSDDPGVVMQAALALAERHARMVLEPIRRADVLKVRALFQRVIELDPTRAAAWAGVGSTYLDQDENVSPGIAALEKSLELEPDSDPVAFRLAMLYIKAKRADAVARLSKQLLESPTVDIASKAYLRGLLEDFDRAAVHEKIAASMNDAIVKANAGQHEEALAIVDAILPSIVDPELHDRAMKFRDEVSAQLKKKK